MSGVGACLALFVLAFQSEQTAATFWLTAALPSDPNDPYYKTFQPVPSPEVTADKIITNVLHIYPVTPDWYKRPPPVLQDVVL